MSIRTYELVGDDKYVFINATINNNAKQMEVLYSDTSLDTVDTQTLFPFKLFCDDDEESILCFNITDPKTMFIIVKCTQETTSSYSKHNFCDLISVGGSGSINPTHVETPAHIESLTHVESANRPVMSTIRTYEIVGDDRFTFSNAHIVNNNSQITITYCDKARDDANVRTPPFLLFCDRDEENIQSFDIKDSKTLIIVVKCKQETTETYFKRNFLELIYLGDSINPNLDLK